MMNNASGSHLHLFMKNLLLHATTYYQLKLQKQRHSSFGDNYSPIIIRIIKLRRMRWVGTCGTNGREEEHV
jgi:hypothetical protein